MLRLDYEAARSSTGEVTENILVNKTISQVAEEAYWYPMNDIYDKLAKRADQGNVEIHPIPVVIVIVAESEDEAHDLASQLGGSARKHPSGDHLVRVSDQAAAELGAHISPRVENESQARLLNELHAMWKEIDSTN